MEVVQPIEEIKQMEVVQPIEEVKHMEVDQPIKKVKTDKKNRAGRVSGLS